MTRFSLPEIEDDYNSSDESEAEIEMSKDNDSD